MKTFSLETPRSVGRKKSNLANLLVKGMSWKGRRGGTSVIGINPNLPVRPALEKLIDRLASLYEVRTVANDILPVELEAFNGGDYPEVDLKALFGTEVRTLTLVVLHLFGGRENIGRLQRSVPGKFVTRVRVQIMGLVEEGVLVKEDRVIRFAPLPWLLELRGLLQALADRMPQVVAHVERMKEARSWTGSGTAHASGQVFRVFGSRVNQAILCYLAVFGPTRIMKMCADISSVNPGAVDPLIEAGLLCCIDAPGSRSKYKVSLNSAFPVYAELREYLRSEPVVAESLEGLDTTTMYAGSDGYEPRAFHEWEPSRIFGTANKDLATSALAILAQAPTGELRFKGIRKLLNDLDAQSLREALHRLENDYGLVVSRRWGPGNGLVFGLNPEYEACEELKGLLLAICREWPREFGNAPVNDPRSDCAVPAAWRGIA